MSGISFLFGVEKWHNWQAELHYIVDDSQFDTYLQKFLPHPFYHEASLSISLLWCIYNFKKIIIPKYYKGSCNDIHMNTRSIV